MTIIFRPFRAAFALLTLGFAGIAAGQTIVFDTTPLAGGASITVWAGNYLAAQRVTVTGPFTRVVGVAINVNDIPIDPWSAALRIYPDNGGTPLTAGDVPNVAGYLGDFGTITNLSTPGLASFVVTPVTLSPGVYWFSIEGTNGMANLVANTASSGGTGAWLTANDYTAATWAGSFTGQPGYTLDMTITAVSAVPEPSTYAAIFGAAVLGLAVWRRRMSAA